MKHLDPRSVAILDAQARAVVATCVGDLPSAASVFYARDGDTLVFFSFLTTRKVEQLRVNPRVQLAIGLEGQDAIRGVQIEGRAELITDGAERRRAREKILAVTTAFERWMDMPVACFVRVRPTLVKHVELGADACFSFFEFPENAPPPVWGAVSAFLRHLLLGVRAVRAPFFTATLVPFALGTALAVRDGAALGWREVLWGLAAALLAHAGTNLANDYFDHRTRNDERNKSFTPVNGGSRTIQAGLWSPDRVLLRALLCFAAAAAIGLFELNVIPRSLVLTLGAVGVGLGFFYSGWPVRLAYHGLGDLAVAVGFGPLITGAAYAILTGRWSWGAAAAALPIAIAVALILFINSFQDEQADAACGKRTSVVRLGKRRAFDVFAAAWAAIYLSIVALVASAVLPGWALLALLTAPLALWAVRRGRARIDSIYELLPVNFATIGLHFGVGLLLTLGVVLQVMTAGMK